MQDYAEADRGYGENEESRKERGLRNGNLFEKGKRFQSNYQTPYGAMEMEVLTKDIVNHLSEEGFGTINIDYHVNLNGIAEGRNLLKIEVLQ